MRSIVPIINMVINFSAQSVTCRAAVSRSCFSLIGRNQVESYAAEMLCHTLNKAAAPLPGVRSARWPEFCLPTSSARDLRWASAR
jgi:hypothetical protein